MRKICLYVVILVLLTFIIPVFFTKVTVESQSMAKDENIIIDTSQTAETEKQEDIKYDYGNYNTIKVLHTKTNSIEEIGLDEYLYGVVCAEMPVDFEVEALKSQAVVARTYTIYKIMQNQSKHGEADICDNSSCCQAWITKEDRFARWEDGKQEENWNKIVSCVNSTKGKIISYEGKPINAFFHSNSGGATEAPSSVWGGERLSISSNC